MKKIYNFEVVNQRGAVVGKVLGEYLSEEEMVFMARGILNGVRLVKKFVTVNVYEEGEYKTCFTAKI